MKRLSELVTRFPRHTWIIVLLIVGGTGVLAGQITRHFQEAERLTLLKTESSRLSIDIMSQTLNSTLMGSLSLLSWFGGEIKKEIQMDGVPATEQVIKTLANLGQLMDASGVLLVGKEGLIKSAWDSAGKPSTGMNVAFRPYYQMAMKGKENVYAAISQARGERALYFSVPVHSGDNKKSSIAGAAVARTGMEKVDALLQKKSDITLLLSPQGVVFASNHPEWIGLLSTTPTEEKIRAIRELKQFGNYFEKNAINRLPFPVDDGMTLMDGRHYAVASANVQWNDPNGDWKLIMMEDLSRTIQAGSALWIGLVSSMLALLMAQMAIKLMRSHHAQLLAAHELQSFADRQAANVEYKSKQAQAGLRFQEADSLTELGQRLLSETHQLFGALQGVVYIQSDEADKYILAGHFACADQVPAALTPGEGLLGQCLLEGNLRVVEAPDERFWRISSGTGETSPKALILAPLILQGKILGIAEIALLKTPDQALCDQLQELLTLFAMSLEILSRNLRMKTTLSGKAESEQALSKQLKFQQSLIDTIPYPIFYKGPDTRFLGINRAYCETFGVSPEDLIGKRVLDLLYLPEADRLTYQAEDEATTANIASVKRQMNIPFADGKLHNTLYFVSGFRQADGSPGGLVGTFIDLDDLPTKNRQSVEHAA